MISHSYQIRVNYSDTDKMGFMHHSNYVKIYENARWETLRHIGIPYSEIEAQDIFMPVVSMDFKFLRPAFYDEELTVTTIISEIPKSKINFIFELRNNKNQIVNRAKLSCAFINSVTNKALRPPIKLIEKISEILSIKKL